MLSHLSRVQLFSTLWTAAHQAPLSMEFSRQELQGILQAILSAISFSRGSSQPRDRTRISYVSCIGRQVHYL